VLYFNLTLTLTLTLHVTAAMPISERPSPFRNCSPQAPKLTQTPTLSLAHPHPSYL